MAKELEIKLSVGPEHIPHAVRWLEQQGDVSVQPSRHLANVYFDTPEGDLNRNRIALRIRQFGQRFIQTLKTQGEFVGGAHHRNEWEWPIAGKALNLSLLDSVPAPAHIDWQQLQPVFETNFVRQILMIKQDDVVIEVAIDSGDIVSGESTLPLNEIEFELKDGEPSALLKWAKGLAAEVPTFLNLISKAEQGYHLAGQRQASAVEAESSSLTALEFLQHLSEAWLLNDGCRFQGRQTDDLRAMANKAGVTVAFDQIFEALRNGANVRELASRKELGQVQLAIASAASESN